MHKFNTLNSSKLSLGRFYSSRSNIKSSKNHYDTLKITPHATQNEVKSAYYKLSLEYHPDKNKSGYAKQKFHDISEAYEVLGNHELRKNYDRDIMIHQPSSSTTAQESTVHNKDKVYSGSSRNYNFDAWMHAHYGEQLYRYRIRRNIYEQHKATEELRRGENSSQIVQYILLLVTLMLAFKYSQEKVDVPVYVTFQII